MALQWTINKGNYDRIVAKSAQILKKGDILVYPTETSYAIGADAMDPEAVERVHMAKQQGTGKAISVVVSDLGQAEMIAEMDGAAIALAERFMPGPLTLVLKKKDCVPEMLSRSGIAFRIPGNRTARDLCKKFGGAITATSANVSGEEPIHSGREAFERFGNVVDAVVDEGNLPGSEASTIFDCRCRKILRTGPVDEEHIKKALAEIEDGKK